MALTIQGTAGGQDGARRAAMQYMSPGQAPAPSAPMAAPGGGGDVVSQIAHHLSEAFKLTQAAPDKKAAMAPWSQAIGMFKEQLNAAQQGGGPMGMQAPSPAPSAMGSMGAQAIAPMVGRPPR